MLRSALFVSLVAAAAVFPSVAHAGCSMDSDCKGDRICVDSRCVDPTPVAPVASVSAPVSLAPVAAPMAAAPAPAAQPPASTGVAQAAPARNDGLLSNAVIHWSVSLLGEGAGLSAEGQSVGGFAPELHI